MKTVVVSGASRGLGLAIVQDFLDGPYRVACCARSPEAPPALAGADPDRFHYASVDISDESQVRDFVAGVRTRWGSVDILVNNAGIAREGILGLQDLDDLDDLLRVNVKGTVALTRECVREMLPSSWGRVITITSIAGHTGFRGLALYGLTKAGLEGMTRALAREVGRTGITVNNVAPGFLETDMTHGLAGDQREQIVRRTPLGRLGTPEDVVGVVRFLASEDAGFITGQTIIVDGGVTS